MPNGMAARVPALGFMIAPEYLPAGISGETCGQHYTASGQLLKRKRPARRCGDACRTHGKWFAMSQPIAISCSESVKISQMSRFGPERVDTPRRAIAALGQSHRSFARRLWRRSLGSIAKLRHGNETWSHMNVFGLNVAVLMRHRPRLSMLRWPPSPKTQ